MRLRWRSVFCAAVYVLLFGTAGFAQNSDDTSLIPNTPIAPLSTVDTIDHTVFSYFITGTMYEQRGNYNLAAASYRRALQRMPQSTEIRTSFAEMLYQLQRYAECIQNLREIKPTTAHAQELMGLTYKGMGRDDSAFIAFRRLVQLDPDNSTGYSFLASYYRQNGSTDSMIWAYQQLIRNNENNYRLPIELGRMLTEAGRYEEAKASYRQSLSLLNDASTSLAWVGLAEIYQAQDSLQQAREMYLNALESDSLDVILHRDLGNLYIRLDSLPQAVAHARRASELAPFDRRMSRRLGSIYFATDSVRLADSVFNWIMQSGEQTAFDLYYMGRIAAAKEQYPTALDYFQRVAQIEDSMPESWLDIAAVYRRMQQPDSEIETFKTGLMHMKNDSTGSRLMFALGASYERNGHFDSATTTFETIIAKMPDNAAALNYLGYMLADKGERLEYARDLIQRAVKLSPDNGAYLDSFGWVLFRLGKYDTALDNLKKASALVSDPVIFEHLGDVYSAKGKKDEARRWWQKALDLDPKNKTVQNKLAK